MQNDLLKAYYFAGNAHNGQKYGNSSKPMTDHLRTVSNLAEEYYDPILEWSISEIQVIAWLHDTLEDTSITFDDLEKKFGLIIAQMVDNVTDADGANRKEKKRNTWHKIRRSKISVYVKLCDRLANMQESVGTPFEKMYKKEFPLFEAALYTPGEFENIWKQLRHFYEL